VAASRRESRATAERTAAVTTSALDTAPTTEARRSPLAALAGVGALAAFAGAAVTFADPLRGATGPADVAERLADTPVTLTAVLLGAYAILGIAVVGRLTATLARARDDGTVRVLPVLGAAHLLLLAVGFTAPAAAVVVGTQVFDGGVTPTAAETALLIINIGHPMAAWFGAAFLIGVVLAGRAAGAPKVLLIVSGVFAIGLLLPPIGWAVSYLMAFWFAGVGVWLWRRG
jgi:hypothetical protein